MTPSGSGWSKLSPCSGTPRRKSASTSWPRCAPTARRRASPSTGRRSKPLSREPPRPARGRGLPPRRDPAGALLLSLRGGEGAARGDRLRGPADPRRPPAGAGRDRRGLPRPLQPPDGRRVPGHQPPAAAADRGVARARQRADGRRRRVPVDLRLPPRRPRRLPRAPAGDGGERRRRDDGAERQLPLPARGDRRRQRTRRRASRRLLQAAAGRRPAPRAGAPRQGTGGRVAAHRPRRLGRGGDRPGADRRRPHTAQLPRRGPLRRRATAGSWPTRESLAARWSCCCAPSPTSTPTRTRWSAPGCVPTSSAGAATGPSSRSPTSARCWRRSPIRSTTKRCSAPSPRPPAGSPPTRSGCCARRRGSGDTSGRRWSRRSERARRSWPSRSAWRRSQRARSRSCGASSRRSPPCASAAPGSPSPA